MQPLNSIGHRSFLNQTQIMLSYIEYLIGLFAKVRSTSMDVTGRELILLCSILTFGG